VNNLRTRRDDIRPSPACREEDWGIDFMLKGSKFSIAREGSGLADGIGGAISQEGIGGA